jgi:hypothetical protein
VLNAVTVTPLVVGAFAGTALAVRERRYDVLRLCVVPIVGILLPVMAAYLDGGFNYRAPATLLFALLTGYAVSHAIGRFTGGEVTDSSADGSASAE